MTAEFARAGLLRGVCAKPVVLTHSNFRQGTSQNLWFRDSRSDLFAAHPSVMGPCGGFSKNVLASNRATDWFSSSAVACSGLSRRTRFRNSVGLLHVTAMVFRLVCFLIAEVVEPFYEFKARCVYIKRRYRQNGNAVGLWRA